MFKKILFVIGLTVSLSAQASTINSFATELNKAIFAETLVESPFDWKVGDSASYKLNMASFINGSMVMTITGLTDTELTMTQDLDLGFAGKQSCEVKLNPATGETISMICNGQAQDPGQAGDIEIIETKEDTVKVPAGTFTCMYIKAKMVKDGTIAEQWINPKEVPVMGLVKSVAQSQMGEVKIELASFKKM